MTIPDLCTLWKPQRLDWCLFSDPTSKSARLSQFNQIAHGSGREGQYKDMQGNYFTLCEPYIGELPSHLVA